MTVLNIRDIAALCENPHYGIPGLIDHQAGRLPLIEGYDEEQLRSENWPRHPASYDLRLGDEFYLVDSANPHGDIRRARALDNQTIVIPEFRMIYVESLENLNVPPSLVGSYDLRMDIVWNGLTLQTGGQIDPGYSGRLLCLLFNFTSQPVSITYGMRIFSAWFEEVRYTAHEEKIAYNRRRNMTMRDAVPSGKIMRSAWSGVADEIRQIHEEQAKASAEAKASQTSLETEVRERQTSTQTGVDAALTRINQLSLGLFTFVSIAVAVIAFIVAPRQMADAGAASLPTTAIGIIAGAAIIIAGFIMGLGFVLIRKFRS